MAISSAETLSLNKIFGIALERKATDIHLMPGNYPVLRIGSQLYVMMEESILTAATVEGLIDSFLTNEEKESLKSQREVKTVYTWADRARFRASVFYQKGFLSMALRMIPKEVPKLDTLNLPANMSEQVTSKQGLIIVCGPFGSGRTTTMASLLNHINNNASKRIVTFERPVEYLLVNNKSIISQREVGKDTSSFAQGLMNVLDEDVDVVAVGEMEEPGVQELVLTTVESGKLVIALMNTNSVISTLEKFLSSIPEEKRAWAKDAFSKSLLVILSQRLVDGISGKRVLATEVLTITSAVIAIIRDENYSQLASVLQTSRDEGMVSLDFKLAQLVADGQISAEEARKYATDPSAIR